MPEILEIGVVDLQSQRKQHILVDVREPDELVGPEGQIEGIILAPLGSRLTQFFISNDPSQSYVFICRSGHRSRQACAIAHTYGFHDVYNMTGGMIAWNNLLMNF
jgi:rhodanese-related sulfurtransferase